MTKSNQVYKMLCGIVCISPENTDRNTYYIVTKNNIQDHLTQAGISFKKMHQNFFEKNF